MSADACYSARSSTRAQVLKAIKRLTLSKNSSEQYNHDDAVKYFTAIKRVLKETYNPGDPGHGMEKLIDENTPGLPREHPTNATSTFTITAQDVLTMYQQRAAALNAQNLTTNVQPLITDRTEAQDHADRLNQQNQAVIGAKEGATEAIVLQFGRDITDSVLKTADGVDFKGIDDYHLYDVVQVCIQGADRPATGDILSHLLNIISTRFDFRKKITNNVEALRAKTARLHTYGVNMDETQIALISSRMSKQRQRRIMERSSKYPSKPSGVGTTTHTYTMPHPSPLSSPNSQQQMQSANSRTHRLQTRGLPMQ